MYGGTTGRHVARHGADPARPGGAPVDPTLGHDMFQRPRPVRVHGGPDPPASGANHLETRLGVRPSNRGDGHTPSCGALAPSGATLGDAGVGVGDMPDSEARCRLGIRCTGDTA